MNNEDFHKPVMCDEVLSMFHGAKLKVFFDGTVGAGGHAKLLLEAHPEIKTYIACDRDPSALKIASETLKPFKGKVKFVHSNHANIGQIISDLALEEVDGFFLI